MCLSTLKITYTKAHNATGLSYQPGLPQGVGQKAPHITTWPLFCAAIRLVGSNALSAHLCGSECLSRLSHPT